MSSPTKTKADFLELAVKSGLVTQAQIEEIFGSNAPSDPNAAANQLLKSGIITPYQAKQLLAGKFRGYFLGTYKILQPIGQGGMGSVFLAEHTSLQRRVAIKVLTAEKAKDKLTLERFNREARAAAALDHPNIVRLHDISQGNGVHFLVMEYVEGNDLHSLMSKTGPLHYAQAVQYIAQAAAGLQHAHDRGFIHRDIKPANLMLNKDGHIKILDMGLARNFNSSSDNLTALLAEGNIAGTVDFLSPEQAMNHPLDERSDIYSLGATFYSLLTGHPPFNGSTAQKLMQHQLKDPPSVMKKLNGRLPPPLSEVLNKMMAKKPSERFQSATDVIDALAPWLPARTSGDIIQDGQPSGAMNYSPSTRNVMKSKGKSKSKDILADGTPLPIWQRKPVIIGAGLLILGVIGGLSAMLFTGPKTPEVSKNNTTPPLNNFNTGNPASSNPPPVNSGPVVRPIPAGWSSVYRTDFKDLSTIRMMTNYKEAFGGSNIRVQAPGWQYEVYDKNSEGEFWTDLDNGVRFLAIGARGGEVASQVAFQPNRDVNVPMKPGVQYEVRFEYQLDDKSPASVSIQKVDPYSSLKSNSLSPTTKWKQGTLAFTMPEEGKVQFCFRPNAISEKSFLKIRAVELLEKGTTTASMPAGKSLITYQASTLKPFESTDANGAIEAGWTGWHQNTYSDEVTGRYVAKDVGDGMALGVAVESGPKNSAQLAFRPNVAQNAAMMDDVTYTATITYKTDPGCNGFASVQTQKEWKMLQNVQLPDTNGTWKKVSIPFVRPAGKESQLTVGPNNVDNKFIWIRAFELGTGDASTPTAAPPPAPKIEKPLGKKLFTLELTSNEEQRGKFQDGAYLAGTGVNLPNGISTFCWKKESVAEFRSGSIEGSPAVGSVNLNDELSSQIRFAVKPELVKKGKKYVAKVEYLTKNDATANLITQFGKDYKRGAMTTLPMSNDKWTTATLRFECLNTEEASLLLENQSVGEGTLVYVRKVEVFEDE